MQLQIIDNRYEIDRVLGEGGMARVYLGRDTRLQRQVAIKIPRPAMIADADFLARFRHEALAAANLAHPNIVDVFDVGTFDGTPYIVMEYVEGTDLKALIKRATALSVAQACAIATDIALGLEAAHRAGMVHRDVKPQNIIVTPDGTARITDFGIAKSTLSTALTETGITFGTVDYIAPEQAQGRPALPQSDIYALGVSLYEMLTGRLPFSGDSAVAVAMQHVTAAPPSPRQFNRSLPPQLEALILQCLAKDPAQRPASARDLARQLRAFNGNTKAIPVAPIEQQATLANPNVFPRPANPLPQPRPINQPNGPSTAKIPTMPPPRPIAAKAPRQSGAGCGTFLIGILILASVLTVMFVFATGIADNFFASLFGGTQRPVPTAAPPVIEATTTPAITPTPTTTPEPTVVVPPLVGQSEAAASFALTQLQLVPVVQQENSETVARGFVLSQELAPGTELRAGAPVTFTVSLGPSTVALPDWRNFALSAAQSQAEGLGLIVAVVEEASSAVDAGFVVRQSPSPGLVVQPGATVTLIVSIGDQLRFPNIIGLDRADAETLLRGLDGIAELTIDEQGRDRLGEQFDQFRAGEVISAAIFVGETGLRPLQNGELIPRGSRIVLGVRGP